MVCSITRGLGYNYRRMYLSIISIFSQITQRKILDKISVVLIAFDCSSRYNGIYGAFCFHDNNLSWIIGIISLIWGWQILNSKNSFVIQEASQSCQSTWNIFSALSYGCFSDATTPTTSRRPATQIPAFSFQTESHACNNSVTIDDDCQQSLRSKQRWAANNRVPIYLPQKRNIPRR
jgi:hypothetical protein